MATLVSANVNEAQTGSWPQVMTVVQEFDRAVIVTEDFEVVFYAKNNSSKQIYGEMVSKPVQYQPNQLVYTVQVSPFANGQIGVKSYIGEIADFYGNVVDLKIGDDFSLYNTTIRPYFPAPLVSPYAWTAGANVLPSSAICPTNTPPKVTVSTGPYNPNLSPMTIPEGMWNGGNFYLWVNFTFKPEIDGEDFVWEPPFYYAWSGFGIPLNQTTTNPFPPVPVPSESLLYNICSSGAASQGVWDTCGWIDLYQKWRGRVQVWAFGNDIFADGVVPWTYPAVASPTGDLSPYAQFGFPADIQEQFYVEYPFVYINP